MNVRTKIWIGIVMLAILSPIGIILPEYFKAGPAWGEWRGNEIQNLTGYIPQGLEKLSRVWNAPIANYAFNGWGGKGLGHLSIGYIVSAVLGIGITVLAALFLGRLLTKNIDEKKGG